jgi:hypothetical protein
MDKVLLQQVLDNRSMSSRKDNAQLALPRS